MASSTSIIPAGSKQNKELIARQATRATVSKGAQYMLKEGTKQAATQGVKQLAKTAGCPMLIAGDIAEIGVERLSGSKNAGRATSLAVYAGTGAAMGGPVGAAGAVAIWGLGQAVSALID